MVTAKRRASTPAASKRDAMPGGAKKLLSDVLDLMAEPQSAESSSLLNAAECNIPYFSLTRRCTEPEASGNSFTSRYSWLRTRSLSLRNP
jgi:hypothetical protein